MPVHSRQTVKLTVGFADCGVWWSAVWGLDSGQYQQERVTGYPDALEVLIFTVRKGETRGRQRKKDCGINKSLPGAYAKPHKACWFICGRVYSVTASRGYMRRTSGGAATHRETECLMTPTLSRSVYCCVCTLEGGLYPKLRQLAWYLSLSPPVCKCVSVCVWVCV